MLNDLRSREFELKSLTARLNDPKRPEQAIGAEMELVVLWSLAQEGSLDVEAPIEGTSSRPDAHSNVLFSDESGEIIEITAINDGALSGKAIMRAAATKLKDEANRISKPNQIGEYLHFSFQEESGYKNGEFYRIRKVKEFFHITEDVTSQLSVWLRDGRPAPQSKLLLENSDISVIITCENRKQLGLYNHFSSMPAVTYSLERNPLFSSLKRKRRQLSGYIGGRRRVIIIADGGSSLLRHMTNGFGGGREVTGEQIIRHFLSTNSDIDAVLAVLAVRGAGIYGVSGASNLALYDICARSLQRSPQARYHKSVCRTLSVSSL